MFDSSTHDSPAVDEQYVSVYDRRHLLRRPLMLLQAIAALAAAAWVYWAVANHDDRLFEPAPVSTAHAFIADKCGHCHGQRGHTENWLATFGDQVPAVSDHACTVCHAGHEHFEPLTGEPSLSCSNCHREHRRREQLTSLDDGPCLVCHSDLSRTARKDSSFVQHVNSFATHPEFAILEASGDKKKRVAGTRHQARSRADFSKSKTRDKATIKLNHALHVRAAGVRDGEGRLVQLDCHHCHVPAESGGMKPISYEDHCSDCHSGELAFAEGLAVPHGDARSAQGVASMLLARMIAGSETNPASEDLSDEWLSLGRLLPRLSSSEFKQLESRSATAIQTLFDRENHGCRYCHTAVARKDAEWHVDAPKIPNVWLPHAHFRHDRHRLLACTECHLGATSSQETADILLPNVASCRNCHQGGGPQPSAGAARSHCVLCHAYHQPEVDFDGPLSVQLKLIQPENIRVPFGAARLPPSHFEPDEPPAE